MLLGTVPPEERIVAGDEDGSLAHAELRLGSSILTIGSGPGTNEAGAASATSL